MTMQEVDTEREREREGGREGGGGGCCWLQTLSII